MRLSQLIVLGVLLGLGAGWWLRRDAGEPVAFARPAAQP
ncbi:MAG: M23 family peptidase, partial [Stenotrophomonas maltophilia]